MYNGLVMGSTVEEMERRIAATKRQLAKVGELRPGILTEQYNVCGKPGCRCKASPPQRHGPYPQLGWTRNGKSTTRFVRREELGTVRKQIKNYARLQKLVQQWVDLSLELCELKRAEARAK